MTDLEWINLGLEIGSIVALVGIAQWIAVYTYLEDWRHNQIGRSLVLMATLAMITPVLFILSLFFDLNRATSDALAWVEIGVLFGVFGLMIRRTFIWIRIARKGREDDS